MVVELKPGMKRKHRLEKDCPHLVPLDWEEEVEEEGSGHRPGNIFTRILAWFGIDVNQCLGRGHGHGHGQGTGSDEGIGRHRKEWVLVWPFLGLSLFVTLSVLILYKRRGGEVFPVFR
jgi:hypothetical protein